MWASAIALVREPWSVPIAVASGLGRLAARTEAGVTP